MALYLAVLVGTMLMATGLGVSTIFYRELRISGLQFPSLAAFYAADSGIECALYYDGLSQQEFDDPGPPPATVQCQGTTPSVTQGSGADMNGPYDTYSFQFQLSSAVGNACAKVRIKKQVVGGDACTRYDSFGWDKDCGSSATVERGIVSLDPEDCDVAY